MDDVGDSMSFEDFLEFSVGQLQFYLTRRGKSISGNKKDLAARALVAFESKEPISDCPKYMSDRLEREYSSLLKKCGIEDPRRIDESSWQHDLTTWPSINLGQIFQYVLSTKAFDTEYIGQYKARKAYSYFKSGHVHKIQTHQPQNSDLVVIRSFVTPSMRISEKPKELWVLISKTTGILSAYCVCTAGFSNCCNHVIAVLYKLQFAVDQGYTNPSCTDIPCKFNDKSNSYKLEAKKVKDMDIVKHDVLKQVPKRKLLNDKKSKFDPRNPRFRQQQSDVMKSFYGKLEAIQPNAVVLLTVPPPESSDCPPLISEIAGEVKATCKDQDDATLLQTFMGKLTFSDKQLDELEKATKGQADSNMWKNQRIGRITASNFHTVHTKVKSIAASRGAVKPLTTPLLIQLTRPSSLDHVNAIQWGRQNECKARAAFFDQIAPEHTNPKLTMCGLRAIKTAPFLAASADNLFACSCCGKYCVEYKCPYSIRDKSVHDGWKETDFLEEIDGCLKLKTKHKYFTQVQGQMAANNCTRTFFVAWTPVGDTHVEIIKFDESHWNEVYGNLILFYKLYVAKVLLGLRELHFCTVCDKRILEPKEFSHKHALQENSIFCESCHQWYHWSCVNITDKNAVATVWVCSSCTDSI